MAHKLNKKMVIIFAIIIFIIGIIFIYIINYNKPYSVIERTIHLKLPSDSIIINYTHGREFGYLYYDTKILISSKSISYINNQLIDLFGIPINKVSDTEIPNLKNVCSWWDLEKQDIKSYYYKEMMNPHRIFLPETKFREVWAFLYQNKNGVYYLYISY